MSSKKEVATQTISERALATIATVNGVEFTTKRRITVPTLGHNFAAGEVAVALEFVGKLVGMQSKQPGAREGILTYAARVIDLTDGQEKNYVASAVIYSELMQAFPDDSYVGKKLVIKKLPGPSGKRYNRAEILEIE